MRTKKNDASSCALSATNARVKINLYNITFVLLALVLLMPNAFAAKTTYGDVDSIQYLGVCDGDTFRAKIPGWPALIGDSIKIRIDGIDCPELNENDSTRARAATHFVDSTLRRAKVINLIRLRRDNFFRIRGNVIVDGKSLGEMLIERNFAVNEADAIVLVTETGKRYHRPGCWYVKEKTNVLEMTRGEARKQGLTPCEICDQ